VIKAESHDFQDVLKAEEVLGTAHAHRRGLLRGRWWPVGPKLILDQTAAPVREIINTASNILILDTSLYHNCNRSTTSSNKRNKEKLCNNINRVLTS
jgi:hypothetical protein